VHGLKHLVVVRVVLVIHFIHVQVSMDTGLLGT
jgi:hypothetical protein